MNKQTQTIVRIASDEVIKNLKEYMDKRGLADASDAALIAQLEIARQIALLVEEMKVQRMAIGELTKTLKGGRDE